MNISERLAKALERRGVAPKEAAYHADVSQMTMYRYLSGETMIGADKLLKLCDALGIRDEVLSDQILWFDAKGGMRKVDDLVSSAREAQGLPENIRGDVAAAARRNMGWVSVEILGQVGKVHYHEFGLSARAVARILEFLPSQVAAMVRIIDLEERDGDRRTSILPAELVHEAGRALEQAAGLREARPVKKWRVDRLAWDNICHPTPQKLAKIASMADDLLTAAARAEVLQECSVFRIDGTSVTTVQVGDSSPLSARVKADLAGRNVMSRPDVRWAEMMRDRVLDASANGNAYHWLDGSINGKHCVWRGALFNCGGGIVISHAEKIRGK